METFRITLVSRDPGVREAAARAFDSAPRHWSLGLAEVTPNEKSGAGRVVWGPDVDAPSGAPRFDPEDPATLAGLATTSGTLVGASAQRGRVFVVTSVAGGSGVSTIALHLARCFAELRRSCVLLEEGDPGWLRHRMNLPEDARSTKDIGGTAESFELSCLPVAGGFKVLLDSPPAVGVGGGLARRAGESFERVIVDVSARARPDDIDAAGGVLVLPPTRTSLRRAERFLERADRFPWAIICNRVGSGGSITPSVLSKELGRAVDVGLPCTPALRDAEDRSELLSKRYRWARSVMRIARALDEL